MRTEKRGKYIANLFLQKLLCLAWWWFTKLTHWTLLHNIDCACLCTSPLFKFNNPDQYYWCQYSRPLNVWPISLVAVLYVWMKTGFLWYFYFWVICPSSRRGHFHEIIYDFHLTLILIYIDLLCTTEAYNSHYMSMVNNEAEIRFWKPLTLSKLGARESLWSRNDTYCTFSLNSSLVTTSCSPSSWV